ncbi:MAG: hypothetical protein ACYDC2_07690 [Solirubrobacteraceae bacterium]
MSLVRRAALGAGVLQTGGALVYGALEAIPTQLVVRSTSGATLETVDFAAKAQEHAEYCAGYAEPPLPPPAPPSAG